MADFTKPWSNKIPCEALNQCSLFVPPKAVPYNIIGTFNLRVKESPTMLQNHGRGQNGAIPAVFVTLENVKTGRYCASPVFK